MFLTGVGSSTVNFWTNVTIITLAARSVFPCGWYCDSSCDTQDNATLTCVSTLSDIHGSRCMFTCPCWMLSTICMALFLLFTFDSKICPLCHLSVTTCTQVCLFDHTGFLTLIKHAVANNTLYFIHCGSYRCKVQISTHFILLQSLKTQEWKELCF